MLSKRVICGLVLCAGVALGVVTIVESAQGKMRITMGTMLRVTQVRPSKDRGKGTNKGISKEVLRALRKEFERKYPSYTLVNKKVAKAELGKKVEFELANGEKFIVKVNSYRPAKKIISLKVQTDDTQTVKIPSKGRRVFIVGEGDFPLIVVLYVKLLQVNR